MYRYLITAASVVMVANIVGYPLVTAISSWTGLENRPLSIGFRAIILGLVAVQLVTSFTLFLNSRKSKENSLFWLAWWLFWAAYLTRMLTDETLVAFGATIPLQQRLLFAVGVTMVPSMALVFNTWKSSSDFILNGIVWFGTMGLAGNLVFILQSASYESTAFSRASTDALNPISFGHLAVSVLLASIWIIAERKATMRKFLMPIPIGLAVLVLVLSSSRGPVLALAVAIVVLMIARPKLVLSLSYSSVFFAGLYVVYYLARRGSDFYVVRRLSAGVFQDDARSYLLRKSFELIYENPVIGAGIDPLNSYPHNILVESYLAVGLFSGIPFTFMFFFTLNRIYLIAKNSGTEFWRCILFVQYAVAGMFSGALPESAAFFSLMVATILVPGKPARIAVTERAPPSILVSRATT